MEIQNVTIEDAEELLDIYAPYVKYTAKHLNMMCLLQKNSDKEL